MSTKKPILSAVLTVLGLLGLASADPADPGPAEPKSGPAPAIAPGQSGEANPAPPPAGPQGVILLTDGQVVRGDIVFDETDCLLKTPFGSKRFPKSRIDKTFSSIQEAYEYKLGQFPDEDTEERLKLAQWCLAQNLPGEAKSQLNAILKLNPKHPRAKAMLEKMEQAEVRRARSRFDPGVQQAKATPDDMPEGAGPKELDPTAIPLSGGKAMAGGIADVPDVFNLPRPTALRISEEFGRSIHPVLQNHCAKCHNDRYPGDFQLRQVRSRRDLNRDTLKLNLEATLQLIDPANPSKSEILSSSLRPHGLGKSKRPIFRGSNDPSYLKISEWVNSVCKPLRKDAIRQASAQVGSADDDERFAADRAVNLGEPAPPAAAVAADRRIAPGRQRPPGPKAMVPPRAPEQAAADPDEFPLVDLSNPTALKSSASVQVPRSLPKGAGTDAPNPAAKASIPPPPARPSADPASADLPELPPEADPAAPAKKPKKPVKIDPAVLERMLKARNGGN